MTTTDFMTNCGGHIIHQAAEIKSSQQCLVISLLNKKQSAHTVNNRQTLAFTTTPQLGVINIMQHASTCHRDAQTSIAPNSGWQKISHISFPAFSLFLCCIALSCPVPLSHDVAILDMRN